MNRPHDNLVEAMEVLAARQPDTPLLHLPGRAPVTYRHLGEQIRHVRDRLRSWGIVPGDVIAGCLASRPLMALACASLPSSSTLAPLSPTLTTEAYASLLRRLLPKAVLVPEAPDHPLHAAAEALGVAEIRAVVDPSASFGSFTLARSASGYRSRVGAQGDAHFAYVLVTSGTTGRPKLVPMAHRQLLAFAKTMVDWLELTPADVGCSLSPFHLAGGLRATLLLPVLGGASFVCLPESDIEGFFAAIDEFRPTYLAAGFAIHREILRRARDFPAQVARSRFRFLRTTQGRLEPEEIDGLERTFGAPVLVGLGSTEAAGIAHDPLPPRHRKRGAVGLPTAGEVAVMDAAGQICPTGTAGEIVVRGPLVFDRYFDDPDLTARSFVSDWFRTGDVGRIDQDGYVFIDGRIDEMINRGGEKISPLEIDTALELLPGIKEAAAFGVPHPTLGEELVAAVVQDAESVVDEAGILEFLRPRLDPRRVPRRIFFIDRLPRTESGKLRRAELPRVVGLDASGTGRGRSGPASPLEAALEVLWSAMLRLDTVGRDDDFFLLGGDSLAGAQLLREVGERFGVDLPIRALFGNAASIAGMARAIEGGGTREVHARFEVIDRRA